MSYINNNPVKAFRKVNREIGAPAGLNIEEALNRLGGSMDLFLELLEIFCKEKIDFGVGFKECINQKEFENAALAAHALKGSASTISAFAVKNAALRLEKACERRDMADISDCLAETEAAVSNVISAWEALDGLYAPEEDA